MGWKRFDPQSQDGKHVQTSFQIEGRGSEILTELLVHKFYRPAKAWRGHRPRYHIEVHTTAGGLEDPSSMSFKMLDLVSAEGPCSQKRVLTRANGAKAKECRLPDSKSGPPPAVFILVRVHDIYAIQNVHKPEDQSSNERGEPSVAFLVDPWALYVSNQIQLSTKGADEYSVKLRKGIRPSCELREPENLEIPPGIEWW